MEKTIEYEIPQIYLKRLLKYDDSASFRIIIDLSQNKCYKNSQQTQTKKEKENNIVIDTTINKARVISRKIDNAYQVDPTINEYSIDFMKGVTARTTNASKEEIEEILRALIKSIIEPIQIQKSQQDLYSIITTILNGSDNINKLKYEISTQEEAISLLSTEFHNESIEYLSGHFIEFISKTDISSIDETIIYDIIDNYISRHQISKTEQKNDEKSENKEGEDANEEIFKILLSKKEDKMLMHFLLSLDIEEYDDDMIEYIYDNIDDEVIENEYARIIGIIRSDFLKLIEAKKTKNKCKGKTREIIECQYNGNELSIIIDYLQKQNGFDLEANNVLKLSGGGAPNPSYPLKNLIKYNSNNMNGETYLNYYNINPNSSDAWIEFDFVNKSVNLTSYTIKTGGHRLKSWRIVGSNDQKEWEIIDHKVSNSETNSIYSLHRFENAKNDKYYRYIRFIQEEVWNGSTYNYYIHLTRIEFFGSISF